MFGLKRFTIRTNYHPSLRQNAERLFEVINGLTIQEQFTTSPREFLVLCEIEWKRFPEDLEEISRGMIENIEWFDEIIPIDSHKKRTLCFIKGHYEPGYTELLMSLTREYLCFIEFPIHATKEYGTFTLVGPPKEVTKLLDFMKEWGSEMEIAGVMDYNLKGRGVLSVLTEKQLSSLKHAYSRGFFDFPRKRDARSLSRELGIKHTTFLTHLRRGQKRLFSYLFQV